jgi:coatomer subunit beta
LAIQSIYVHSEHLIPDAPDLIEAFLQGESDNTCKRNAFASLSAISHPKALGYLNSVFDEIPNSDELTQLVLIEFIRKDAVINSGNKVRAGIR